MSCNPNNFWERTFWTLATTAHWTYQHKVRSWLNLNDWLYFWIQWCVWKIRKNVRCTVAHICLNMLAKKPCSRNGQRTSDQPPAGAAHIVRPLIGALRALPRPGAPGSQAMEQIAMHPKLGFRCRGLLYANLTKKQALCSIKCVRPLSSNAMCWQHVSRALFSHEELYSTCYVAGLSESICCGGFVKAHGFQLPGTRC